MRKISAKIIADSINPQGNRITTFELIYPRYIHGEVLTHRVFSKNSASSRAIPFAKIVKSVQEEPFIPIAFQEHHKGMQGNSYLSGIREKRAIKNWLRARDKAVETATNLYEAGVTKQLCNRILEPFLYHKVLLTSTKFNNFFYLRCPRYTITDNDGDTFSFKSKKEAIEFFGEEHFLNSIQKSLGDLTCTEWLMTNTGMAEIHIMDLAEKMYDALNESTPELLADGEWHIPYSDNMPEYSAEGESLLTTSDEDKEFHKNRQMFVIRDGKILFAAYRTPLSHTEYFGDITDIVRGFVIGGEVYTYINQFTPVESDEVREYFGAGYIFYAGAKDLFHYEYGMDWRLMISVARCARLSYQTIGDTPSIDYKKDMELFNTLKDSQHWSPFEHVAAAASIMDMDSVLDSRNFNGFIQCRSLFDGQ